MRLFRYFILIMLVPVAAAWSADKDLRVYLPAEKTVETDTPQLGQIGLLLGDAGLVKTAECVKLGQFAATGQQLVIDRQTVLSCLASAGIDARQVQFNGAESVCLKRNEQTISAGRFLEAAQTLLENRLGQQKASWKLLRPVDDYVLAGNASDIQLKADLSGPQSRSVQRVKVAVMQGDIEIGAQEIFFAVQYERKRVVAAQRLTAGTELTTDNTRIETYTSNLPQEDMFLPYGMIALRVIDSGSPIEAGWVEPKTAPLLIKRQQQVILKIDSALLLVSAYGEAMEDGKVGELIRVRRGSRQTNDERFVVGRVMQDGTVQPVLNSQ